MVKHHEFYFTCHNKRLFGQYWEPQAPKAVIILVHGMGEHSGRYSDFVVPELIAQQFAIFAFDHFGHGHSQGKRGCCPNYQAILDSVEEVFSIVNGKFKVLPKFLYGHSMGGNVVLNYILRRNPKIMGAIVTSPFLELSFKPSPIKIFLGKCIGTVFKNMTLKSDLDVSHLTKDENELKKYKADTLVHDKISPGFFFPFLNSGAWVLKKASSLAVPVLLIHGDADNVTSFAASKVLAQNSPKIDFIPIKNGYHELHNDTDRELVLNSIAKWLNSKL
ncbi:lysophospholipase [Zhouia sp. PK063]|uniref:lysophospholipase n=1 Tax=Zhouia sp. PK063 TaxID=3373602 RepID=UPI0037A3D36C